MARTAGWRLALRIARREAGRNRGRSALIVAMIALPVLGLSAADIVIRTADLDPAENARRAIGGADLSAQLVAEGPITQQAGDVFNYASEGEPAYGDAAPDLPAGSSLTSVEEGTVTVRTVAGERSVLVRTFDAESALTDGLAHLLDGRLPAANGEVAISPAVSERTGAGIGDRLWLADGTAYDTVGLAVDPENANDDTLVAPPGTVPFTVYGEGPSTPPVFLVDLPGGTDVEALRRELNAAGYAVQLREWLLDPPPTYQDPRVTELLIGLTTVTVGLALLQVVLLAGAAFAVGARRQRRALGLYAATGARPRDVGRTVLAGGLVLGVLAGALGVVLGLMLAWPLRWVIEDQLGTLYGDWHIRWLELAAVAVLGVLTGLLSALLPARTAARQDPLRALTQRPDEPRSGLRLTSAGLGLVALGLAVTVFGSTRSPVSYSLILGGAIAVELGFVLCAPAMVGAAGRLAGRFPVPLRMALRDASRHRNRSGPAVAAVMAALAGCVAVSIFYVSQEAEAERAYVPTARPGQVSISPSVTPEDEDAGLPNATRAAVVEAVPGSRLVSWRSLAGECLADPCDAYVSAVSESGVPGLGNLQPVIGGSDLLRAALGRTDPAAEQALADGRVVALDPAFVRGGQLTFETITFDANGAAEITGTQRVDAMAVEAPGAYSYLLAVMSKDAAATLGLVPSGPPSYVLETTNAPTADQEDRLTELSAGGTVFAFDVERGYTSPAGPILLSLLGASVVVVLGATAISTGLAAADGRADVSTLAAVGAAPRTRRLLAMSQAAVVAFLGAVLGALAGFVPAAALVQTLGDWPLTIPWLVVGAILVVVPLIAAAFAGLFTRSRLPMLRRTA